MIPEPLTVSPAIRTPYRFSIDDVDRMIDAGVFPADLRAELIEGQLIEMPAPNSPHARFVDTLTEIFVLAAHGRAIVRVQNPLRLDDYNEPHPDLAVVRLRDDRYLNSHPNGEEALLVVEVCDTTLWYDRTIKAPIYARAGVPELWLIDVNAKRIEVCRRPGADGYDLIERLGPDAVLRPGAFQDLAIEASHIF